MKKVCLNIGEANGLGDLICATPTIRKLSQAYNQKITVLSKMPELFKNNPFVEKSFKVSSVDMNYFETFYIMHNSFYNVGHKNERGIEYKHNMIDIRQIHAINLGFTLLDNEMDCFYAPTEELQHNIPFEDYILIHPVKNWDSRTWAAENWMLLTKAMNDMGYPVISIGKDSSESGFFNVDKPVFNFEIQHGLNLMNKTTISDCYHLIDKAAYFITMDSGLLHLAGCTNTRIIYLGSNIDPEYRMPYRYGQKGRGIDYVQGSCKLNCGSDMKYGVAEWGNIQGVPPLIKCLENKPTYECHPSVQDVLDYINL